MLPSASAGAVMRRRSRIVAALKGRRRSRPFSTGWMLVCEIRVDMAAAWASPRLAACLRSEAPRSRPSTTIGIRLRAAYTAKSRVTEWTCA